MDLKSTSFSHAKGQSQHYSAVLGLGASAWVPVCSCWACRWMNRLWVLTAARSGHSPRSTAAGSGAFVQKRLWWLCDTPGLQHSASLLTVGGMPSPHSRDKSAIKPRIFVNWMYKKGCLGAFSISLAVSERRGLFLSLRCSALATRCVKATQYG